jgi:hypothetical protein
MYDNLLERSLLIGLVVLLALRQRRYRFGPLIQVAGIARYTTKNSYCHGFRSIVSSRSHSSEHAMEQRDHGLSCTVTVHSPVTKRSQADRQTLPAQSLFIDC